MWPRRQWTVDLEAVDPEVVRIRRHALDAGTALAVDSDDGAINAHLHSHSVSRSRLFVENEVNQIATGGREIRFDGVAAARTKVDVVPVAPQSFPGPGRGRRDHGGCSAQTARLRFHLLICDVTDPLRVPDIPRSDRVIDRVHKGEQALDRRFGT